jgi:thiosulfate dehydrogenase
MSWKGILLGFAAGVVTVPLLAMAYLKLGYAPVATSSPPMPFEKYFARNALHARVFKEAPHDDPVPATEINAMAGAKLYRQHCSVCHGLPGQAMTSIAAGMFPRPPQLLKGKGVTDDPPGETYWKIRNGIRLSGMPGFQHSLSDQEMWQIAGVLAHANELAPAVRAEMSRRDAAPGGPNEASAVPPQTGAADRSSHP